MISLGKNSWEMTELPGVLISDAKYQELFWNINTDDFVKEIIPGIWLVFFQQGTEEKTKGWAKENGGQFIHTSESLIQRRITRFERENPTIIEQVMTDILKAQFEYVMTGSATFEIPARKAKP